MKRHTCPYAQRYVADTHLPLLAPSFALYLVRTLAVSCGEGMSTACHVCAIVYRGDPRAIVSHCEPLLSIGGLFARAASFRQTLYPLQNGP